MKLPVTILAGLCLLFNGIAFSQQYPFITYTTKDGLVSNRVRKIYQDSRGRLYFLTYNGLSVYDGARFRNYTIQDGLADDLVTDVMEMGEDSLWIATNVFSMNCLVHGKITKLKTTDGYCPIVNQLYRDADGKLYAASDQGIFLYGHNKFIHLSFIDKNGKDAGLLITYIQALNDHLMLAQSQPVDPSEKPTLFLYNYVQQKIIADTAASNFCAAPGNNIWVATQQGLRMVDMDALAANKIVLNHLPQQYNKITSYVADYIFFDRSGNCWLPSATGLLTKCTANGNITVFSSQKSVNEKQPDEIFQDNEGILWLHFLQSGVSKLAATDLSVFDEISGLYHVSDIDYRYNTLLLYDDETKKVIISKNTSIQTYVVDSKMDFTALTITAKGIYATSGFNIYKLIPSEKNKLTPVEIKVDSNFIQSYGKGIEDNYGNLILTGNKYLTAVIDGRKTFNVPINYYADELTKDKAGNIWVANRINQVMEFSVHPENPAKYLQPEKRYEKEFQNMNIRAAAFDSSGCMWLGTRTKGLFKIRFKNNKPVMQNFTERDGLSDNFNSYLACDATNNIWSCSPSGLDKISFKNDKIVVNNISQQSNLYGTVNKIIFDKDSTAWALLQAGIIFKVTPEKKFTSNYTPRLYLSYIKAGRDTITSASSYTFSYKDNNLSFYFAAPSFFSEKQIQYSYRLQGSADTSWTEPSSTASINLLNLAPGNYKLQTRVSFPSARYPDQMMEIPLSIVPPWWKTQWFIVLIIVAATVVFFAGVKLYVRRKLARQRIILEKQEAISKERTRIATDIHDDLGAGLSRIKFLSETIALKKQLQQPSEDDISRIRDYAHEMIDKMGEIVWALNEKNDSLSDLMAYTRAYAVEYLTQNGITCNAQIPENFPALIVSGEMRRNIFLTVKEALHNIVKHAQADHADINISAEKDITIIIADNGIGFNKENIRQFSNGINNMQKRIYEIGGSIEIKNDKGTIVLIRVTLSS